MRLAELAADLASGRATSRKLVEQSLEKIADPKGEGHLAFLSVDAEGARAAADYQDCLRKAGRAPSQFSGIPFSVKDLFDLAGQVTTAGSKVLLAEPAAAQDADAIAALKAKGFVVLGRTNMTEFAYSGVGLNPHYGTPRSPFQRERGRIPGGSSSGAAVAVADGMCALSIGTDTGGSCRIPAAYNGIVGFKPSALRVSKRGAYPLSSSLDSIGPLANSVACCASADAIMAGDWDGVIVTGPSRQMRLGILRTFAMDGLDPQVAEDFERKITALKSHGALIEDVDFAELSVLPKLLKNGGIVGAEASYVHRDLIALRGSEYDSRVAGRIKLAGGTTAADYMALLSQRAVLIDIFERLSRGFDALVLPTVANVAPELSQFKTDDDYFRLNGISLRNTYLANFLNGCAISMPMHLAETAPTGFMIMAPNGFDMSLFSVAKSIA
jgi:aspartyl-tRNA(Asn)/glutamyl-tRNA(Gln) amidotransferase subunit A